MASRDVTSGETPEVQIPLTPASEYFRSIFDKADADHDGVISIQELQALIEDQELTDDPLPRPVVARIHSMGDTNRDGQLDYEEFVRMINDPKLENIFGKFVNKYVKFIIPRKKLTNEPDNFYEDQYSCRPPKLGMVLISVVELIFFLIDELIETDSTKFASGPMARIFIFDPSKRYEVWRFLTYMFVHIGHLHLIVNLVIQIFLGIPLEMVHGCWRVLAIYTAGVVAGSLGTSITDPTSRLAGASGGVYSLITAHISTIILNWSEMSFPAVQLAIFLLITGIDVGTSIYNRYVENMDEHIGYVAHFAGAVAGLLVGINVLRNFRVTKKETYIWWISIVTYVALMLFAVCWNIFYSDFFPKSL